ncbi:MAG: GAF domain-containing protein [Planctomycetota bacterium]|nr:GAF domain-containing protein [Planctomycetota bacterium]
MARRTTPPPAPAQTLKDASVLVVSAKRARREDLARSLGAWAGHVESCDAEHAPQHASRADLVLLDLPGSIDLWLRLEHARPGLAGVIVRESPDAAFLTRALRAGVGDVLDAAAGPDTIAHSLAGAWARVQRSQRGVVRERRRVRRLLALAAHLRGSRRELAQQMSDLCAQMAGSYRDLSDQMRTVSMCSELSAILRQELDVESLLRTTLEYTLRRIGSTNAAIFLPNSLGDYTLGAYVNYDCPKDASESMFADMAEVVAPAFESGEAPVVLRTPAEITGALGRESPCLQDRSMVAIPCRAQGECVGVALFFRDRRTPFADAHVRTLGLIGSLFAEQMARVVRTHNRHLPKSQWDGPGEAGPDDFDLRA